MKKITALLLILLLPGIANAEPIKLLCTKSVDYCPAGDGTFEHTFYLDTDDLGDSNKLIESELSVCGQSAPLIQKVMLVSATTRTINLELFLTETLSTPFNVDRYDLTAGERDDRDFTCVIEKDSTTRKL